MKTILTLALTLLLLSGCIVTRQERVVQAPPPASVPPSYPPAEPYQGHPRGYQVFYDELAPYGDWVNYPNYGYVWIPEGIYGFVPYHTGGYWAYTDYGYTWISDYEWGWAPFHYGRWNFDPFYGWFWVPGYNWAPAWVTWGTCNNYYGWAPMPSNYGYGNYTPPNNQWTWVDGHHLNSGNWNNYQVNSNNTTIINNNITIINNYNGNSGDEGRYHRGPRKEDIEKTTGNTIPVIKINDNDKPGKDQVRNEQIKMYRPGIDKKTDAAIQPKKVKPLEQVKKNEQAPAKPTEVKQPYQKPAEMNPPAVPAPTNTRPLPTQPPKQNQGADQPKPANQRPEPPAPVNPPSNKAVNPPAQPAQPQPGTQPNRGIQNPPQPSKNPRSPQVKSRGKHEAPQKKDNKVKKEEEKAPAKKDNSDQEKK